MLYRLMAEGSISFKSILISTYLALFGFPDGSNGRVSDEAMTTSSSHSKLKSSPRSRGTSGVLWWVGLTLVRYPSDWS